MDPDLKGIKSGSCSSLSVMSLLLLSLIPNAVASSIGSSAAFVGQTCASELLQPINRLHCHRPRTYSLINILSFSQQRTPEEAPDRRRRRAKLNGKLPIVSRTVPLGIPNPKIDNNNKDDNTEISELSVTVWEIEKPNEMIELWWSSGEADKDTMGDPFGVVMWPGSILAAREMHARMPEIEGKTVLVLGAGTGLEAQAAALLGAKRVIATDINAVSLKLLNYGIKEAGLGEVVESSVFDLFCTDPLPEADVVLAADILYNQELGMQVGKRLMELLSIPLERRPAIIVSDSQRFHGTDFVPLLNGELTRVGRPIIEWEERHLQVTTSGILVEEDQTYDVTARIISI